MRVQIRVYPKSPRVRIVREGKSKESLTKVRLFFCYKLLALLHFTRNILPLED